MSLWLVVIVLNLFITGLFGWMALRAGKYSFMMGLLTGSFVFFSLYHTARHVMGLSLLAEIFETFAILFLAAFVIKKFMEGV